MSELLSLKNILDDGYNASGSYNHECYDKNTARIVEDYMLKLLNSTVTDDMIGIKGVGISEIKILNLCDYNFYTGDDGCILIDIPTQFKLFDNKSRDLSGISSDTDEEEHKAIIIPFANKISRVLKRKLAGIPQPFSDKFEGMVTEDIYVTNGFNKYTYIDDNSDTHPRNPTYFIILHIAFEMDYEFEFE